MKLIREHINEKFTEDSDPIRDMGIGRKHLQKIWDKEYKRIGGISSFRTYNEYFGVDYNDDLYKHDVIMLIYETLKYLAEHYTVPFNDAFEYAAINDHYKKYFHSSYSKGPEIIEKAITFLNKNFYTNIDVDLFKSLNEGFTEDSDPIRDLGIGMPGIWANLKKGDVIKVKKFIRNNFPDRGDHLLILSIDTSWSATPGNIVINYVWAGKNIKDVLSYVESKQKRSYSSKWELSYEFFEEYFDYIGNFELKESLNEKFTEDSDPISDMGIGIHDFWKKELKRIGIIRIGVLIEQYFKGEKYAGDMTTFLYNMLRILVDCKTCKPQQAFEKVLKNTYSEHYTKKILEEKKSILRLIDVLKNEFYIDVKFPRKNVLEEKFTEGSDPIKDMGIGFYRKRNFKNQDERITWIIDNLPAILGTEEIPKNILKSKKLWINNYYINKIEKFIDKYLLIDDRHVTIYWHKLHDELRNKGFEP